MPRTAKKVVSPVSKTTAKSVKKQTTKPKSSPKIVKVSIKSKIPNTPAKRVEKGKMSIDTEQMLKDLVELGRIKDEPKKQEKNRTQTKYNAFTDLSKSPLNNYIKEKNSGWIFRFSLMFFFVVLFIFLFIIYIINAKATIKLNLKENNTTSQIQRTFNIYDIDDLAVANANNNIIVINSSLPVEVNDSYIISTQMVKAEKAEGKINIVNDSTVPYTLVATTRFVSDITGNLYRLKETTTVPAGEAVEAEIYADKVTETGEDKNVRFTIIGFNSEETRKLVYGRSIETIDFDVAAKAIVSEEDIKNAQTSLETKLRQEAMNKIQSAVSKYENFVMLSDSFNFKITNFSLNGVEDGDEVNEIKSNGKATVSALFVDKNRLLDLIKTNILSQTISSKNISIKENTLNYYLTKTDLTNKIASLSISVDSYTSYNIDQLIEKEDIVGMKISDFYDYIQDKGIASKIQVISKPFWNKRLPKIMDNISIVAQ